MAAYRGRPRWSACMVTVTLLFMLASLGWPLYVFHRHWTTDGTNHTAISATGWIVEAVWLALIAGGLVLPVALARRRNSRHRNSGDGLGG